MRDDQESVVCSRQALGTPQRAKEAMILAPAMTFSWSGGGAKPGSIRKSIEVRRNEREERV